DAAYGIVVAGALLVDTFSHQPTWLLSAAVLLLAPAMQDIRFHQYHRDHAENPTLYFHPLFPSANGGWVWTMAAVSSDAAAEPGHTCVTRLCDPRTNKSVCECRRTLMRKIRIGDRHSGASD